MKIINEKKTIPSKDWSNAVFWREAGLAEEGWSVIVDLSGRTFACLGHDLHLVTCGLEDLTRREAIGTAFVPNTGVEGALRQCHTDRPGDWGLGSSSHATDNRRPKRCCLPSTRRAFELCQPRPSCRCLRCRRSSPPANHRCG